MKASVVVNRWIAGVTAVFGIVGIYATLALFPMQSALDDVEAHVVDLRVASTRTERQVEANTEALKDLEEIKTYVKAVALVLNVKGEDIEKVKADSDTLYAHRNDGGVGVKKD